jgi:hypothetical protein
MLKGSEVIVSLKTGMIGNTEASLWSKKFKISGINGGDINGDRP